MPPQASIAPPLIFGEVLFDRFPDGRQVLGGAPFNVAWHLQGWGLAPLLFSRIGLDPPGAHIQAAMQRWGMNRAALQHDPDHPTGAVEVSIAHGEPNFDIPPGSAWDFIAPPVPLRSPPALLYHGSLALRAPESRRAWQSLLAPDLPRFVDLNLRPPWWTPDLVTLALGGARWVKLNAEEFEIVANLEGLDPAPFIRRAERLRRQKGWETLIVTLGAQGALAVGEGPTIQVPPPPVTDFVDAVGAGDGLAAMWIRGILSGWSQEETLHRAVAFAARICTQTGATAPDFTRYEEDKS
ncbi:MAG: carbohydrate kinase [Alphaproteobacteria bacterium CG_4_10_14_0_2_um_filter_63_37]|nr:MAG: hypothetical protein AUJ55_12985 [Proteobacteria bacterium CG1_02_64_396]PJA25167.1 MAG: carbohydrate kinase [Alphaproteobacteria bacterium CG_4_10_14_0_2_um_filter_63_37]